MSEAHAEKFAQIVARDEALLARLGVDQVTDEAAARICVGKAVKEAKAIGLEFTEEEGYAWMKREETPSDELTDAQLEAVAGGKRGRDPVYDRPHSASDSVWSRGWDAPSGQTAAMQGGGVAVAILSRFRGW